MEAPGRSRDPGAPVFTPILAPDRAAETRSPAHGAGLGSSGPGSREGGRDAGGVQPGLGELSGTPGRTCWRSAVAPPPSRPPGTGPALTEHLLAALRVRLVGVDPLEVAAARAVAHGGAGSAARSGVRGSARLRSTCRPARAARESLGPRGGDSEAVPGAPQERQARGGATSGLAAAAAGLGTTTTSAGKRDCERATRESPRPPGCARTPRRARQPSLPGSPVSRRPRRG